VRSSSKEEPTKEGREERDGMGGDTCCGRAPAISPLRSTWPLRGCPVTRYPTLVIIIIMINRDITRPFLSLSSNSYRFDSIRIRA